VHAGSTAERYCTEDCEMMCVVALLERCCTEDSEMKCMVALMKDGCTETAR